MLIFELQHLFDKSINKKKNYRNQYKKKNTETKTNSI